MFKFMKAQKNIPEIPLDISKKRTTDRRVSFDTNYLGCGKCMDRRKTIRRKEDGFDHDAYERLCQKRLGPGWL